MSGSEFLKLKASNKENVPAQIPFTVTMIRGSFEEMLCVKLLSIPHKKQAARTPRAPIEIPHPPFIFHDNNMLAAVMDKTAIHICFPIASLKANTAIKVVAVPSKFKSSEAVAAGVFLKLNYLYVVRKTNDHISRKPYHQAYTPVYLPVGSLKSCKQLQLHGLIRTTHILVIQNAFSLRRLY